MKILIIGASGLVGGNLYEVYNADQSCELLIGTHSQYETPLTIKYSTSDENLPPEIANVNWDVIVHTGALTHVDKCETEPELSYNLTVLSTKRLLEVAKRSNAKFVYTSTDYVFDGENGPYSEESFPNPLNIYGKHKLEAENLVIEYGNSLVLRITNVYGKELRKKNYISRTIDALADGKTVFEIDAPYDQFATPINALDVARAITLLVKDDKTGIYHIASTDFMSRVQLLQGISKGLGKKININPISTESLKQPAKRPLKGGLISAKFTSEYPTFEFSTVSDYLQKL